MKETKAKYHIIELIPFFDIDSDAILVNLLLEKLNLIVSNEKETRMRISDLTLMEIGASRGQLLKHVLKERLEQDAYLQKIKKVHDALNRCEFMGEFCNQAKISPCIDSDGEVTDCYEVDSKNKICQHCKERRLRIRYKEHEVKENHRTFIKGFITDDMILIKNVINKITNKLEKIKQNQR